MIITENLIQNRLKICSRTSFCSVISVIIIFLFSVQNSYSQITNYDEPRRGSIYFSLGYGAEFYNSSKIHIIQDALKNNYTILDVIGKDNGGPNTNFSLSSLNFRFGYYFNYNQNSGIELSYDPCKYFLPDNQSVHISGTKNNIHVDELAMFSKALGNYYYLDNGGGIIQFNFSGRYGIYRKISYNFALDLIGKAGIGAITPNVDNSLDGKQNSAGTQLGGINFGLETGIRWVSHRHYCIELTYKYNYAMLSNLKIYEGWASQNISAGSLALRATLFLPTTKHNPLFDQGWSHRKRITHERSMYLIDAQY